MAKQTEIGYEASKEWQDYQTGGTRIDAADLNHIEQGVTDACDAVDDLRTKRLPTYLVAQDGDTATQDLYQEPILGPCLILDLAERATYYDNGEDGEPHERALITSGAQIDADREYISQKCATMNVQRSVLTFQTSNNRRELMVVGADGSRMTLWWDSEGIGCYNASESRGEWEIKPA